MCLAMVYAQSAAQLATYIHHTLAMHATASDALEATTQVYTEEDQDPLPLPLLRKYISYARAHVRPVLSDEAKEARPSDCITSRRHDVWRVSLDRAVRGRDARYQPCHG